MLVSEFDYILPENLIAQEPAPERDSSKLMVLNRADGALRHRAFRDIPAILKPGDLLVMNDTRVFPARLFGHRGSGGKVEALILGEDPQGRLRTLLKTGGRVHPGEIIALAGDKLRIRVLEKDETGAWSFVALCEDFWAELEKLGKVPLPPYIRRDYDSSRDDSSDEERYQTVYARRRGSAAAPTAGLHFTPALLETLASRGIETCFLTLHIGYETFRPVKEDKVEDHVMHSEFYSVPAETLVALEQAKENNRRIIAVGTTVCRVLETLARAGTKNKTGMTGWTDIFIYPGFEFRTVDAMVTNFHLPRSTLLMLVAAFAGTERILTAYHEAVRLNYRFYSYGDAMLII